MNIPPIILITGTDTGVGKTITSAALAALSQQRGRSVAVYKPCQTGAKHGDSDTTEILRLSGPITAETGVVLQEPLAPVAAAAIDKTPLPRLTAHAGRVRALAAAHDHVLVEGAGGLLVELDSQAGTLAGLGELLHAPFVLVTRPDLGTLNHTALTLEALKARELQVLGIVVGSWPDDPGFLHHSNYVALHGFRVPFLGAIPERASALGPAVFRANTPDWLKGLPA
jgi:dethiobiotin synthase